MKRETALWAGSAVAIEGQAVLIEGHSGSGKSSLALELIDRGAALIGDDGVILTRKGAQIIASAPPNIAGKIEIRHVGIAQLETVQAPLALVIALRPEAPRPIEIEGLRELLGIKVPCVILPCHDTLLALRAEWSLRLASATLTH